MSKTLVAVVDTVFPTLDPARDVLAKVDAELVMAEQPTPDSILSVASEADAVLVTYGKITSEVIDGLKNCKVIGRFGIGIDNIRQVPCDGNGHMDIVKLEAMIELSIQNGEKPFFVGATAGTTVRGVFDPFEKIASICKEHGMWYHIDGSWGGSALLSKKHRTLLRGSELSDSFTWCAHKMMGIPLMCTSIILKDKTLLKQVNSVPGTDYLFHGDDGEELDLGLHSLQCGRRVDSLKLWLAWKYFGDDGYEDRIDNLFSMAQHAELRINQSKILELLSPVESLNVCFRIQPPTVDEKKWNELTIMVRDRLIMNADTLVNHASINDKSCIRLITVNFDLTLDDIDEFMKNVEEIAQELANELSK